MTSIVLIFAVNTLDAVAMYVCIIRAFTIGMCHVQELSGLQECPKFGSYVSSLASLTSSSTLITSSNSSFFHMSLLFSQSYLG